MSIDDGSASLWRPLRSPTFRNLLIADVVSDVGTFMQSVGAAWLMVSLNAGPMYIALTQTASALPFFIFALPAGAIGDIVDRRKLILFTEIWMIVVAVVLATMTIAGRMSPVLLLILTFALSAGDAFETPTWRAVLPELVRKEDLPAASALNGIEFNFARAIGPALAGFVIALAGIGTAFLLTPCPSSGSFSSSRAGSGPPLNEPRRPRPLLVQRSRRLDMCAIPQRFGFYCYGEEQQCSSQAAFWRCYHPSLIALAIVRLDTEPCSGALAAAPFLAHP